MKIFEVNTNVYVGDKFDEVISKIKAKKAFIVTDSVMSKIGMTKKFENIFKQKNIDYRIFNEVEVDPAFEIVSKALNKVIDFLPDVMVAIGGGSSLDTAKSIKYFVKKSGLSIPLIALPTTSGTGSEVTTYSVVTSGNKKIPLSDVEMLPDIAILNPVFTETLPPAVIGDTGMDVLTHAIEAYVSANPNLFSRTLAIGAIRTVFSDLVKNYENPSLEKERTNMQIASCMAGVAFSTSSLGINHSVAHSVGALFHKPHGRLNAVLMPKIIAFNAKNPAARKAYCEIARALDFIPKTEQEGVEILIKGIEMRNAKMGIPKRLRDLGIPKDEYFKQIDKIISDIENDMCTEYNPRKFSYAEIKELLEEVY